MENNNKVSIAGQWYGYFSYGPEYGPELEGEKVIFSFLIENVFNNKFTGKCIELEGFGASTEISTIEGFIENKFISFSKEYPTNLSMDEQGVEVKSEENLKPRLAYNGQYNEKTGTFSGTWELWTNERSAGEDIFVDIDTGNWEISKDSSKYGV